MNRIGILFGRISLRARMSALIAAALLPLGGFIGVFAMASYEDALADARREVLQAAEFAASRQAEVFATSRILLDTLRRSDGVSVAGGPQCEATLAGVRAANSQFLSVGLTDAAGVITCHDRLRRQQPFTDPELIRRIMAADAPEFIVGNFMIGKVTGQPTVALAMPMRDADGAKVGMVFASLNLDHLLLAVQDASVGGQRAVAIVQPASDRVLTYYPSASFGHGTRFPGHPLIATMRNTPAGGVVEAVGFAGVQRIFGFVPIPGAETAGLVLAVGEATDIVLAPARTKTLRWFALAALAFGYAVGGGWWLGDRLQLRPIAQLTGRAARLAAGDYAAGARLAVWHSPELRHLGEILDRTAEKLDAAREGERAVAASEARYRLLSENAADLVLGIDANGRRMFVSPASRELLGYDPDDLMVRRARDFIHPEDMNAVTAMMASLRAGRSAPNVQYRLRHRDGRYVWVEVNARPTESGSAVLAVRDITRRREMETELAEANRRLAALAATDALTGLLNRRAFDAALGEAFAAAGTDRDDLTVMMIDVDRFKRFNDRYGHTAGDDCLRGVAGALRAMLRRPGVALARYGGEEFAAVLPETTLSAALAEADAVRRAVRKAAWPHEASEHGIVTVSIGLATLSGGRGLDAPVDLVRSADRALYAAKAGGRDRIEIGFATVESAGAVAS